MSKTKSGPAVAIVMGSDSDLPVAEKAAEALAEFGVSHVLRVLSAHRTPDEVRAFVREFEEGGGKVFVAAAGGAAHLAGTIAAHTVLPVIGIPVPIPPFDGLDSLLSTVQMPGGIPVAAVGAGPGGAKNAGLLAVEILALSDAALTRRLRASRVAMRNAVLEKDRRIRVRKP